jgi:predicted ester cyclase
MGKTRDVVERFYERFGANDLDGAFACFAPECIAVGLSGPLDNSAHHAAALALKKAMPDCHMELVRILEMADQIYVTGRFKGTHTGDLSTPLGPVAASGKGLDLLFVDYFRVANKKIVECEVVRDRLGMMIQLGALPASNGANLSGPRAHRRGASMDSSENLGGIQRQPPGSHALAVEYPLPFLPGRRRGAHSKLPRASRRG